MTSLYSIGVDAMGFKLPYIFFEQARHGKAVRSFNADKDKQRGHVVLPI
jgi:hypothetical protein